MSNLYAERDIIKQEEFYTRHVSAMTKEGLDRKSDIAAELAHRDITVSNQQKHIEALQARVAELECMVRAFRACVDIQMVPSWGSPCHDQIHALVGKNTEEGT